MRQLFRVRGVFAHRAVRIGLAALVCWVVYGQIGRWVVRPAALRQLRQLCEGRVKMGAVEFRGGRHIICRDVVIEGGEDLEQAIEDHGQDAHATDHGQDARATGAYDRQMIYAKEVRGRLSLWSLLRFRLRLKRITFSEVHVNAQYDVDRRTVNLAGLALAAGAGGGRLPIITIEQGELRVSSISGGKSTSHAVIGLNGSIVPAPGKGGDYSFQFSANDRPFGGSSLRGTWQGSRRHIRLSEGRILMGDWPVLGNSWRMEDLALEVSYTDEDIFLDRFEWRTGRSRGRITGAVRDYRGAGEYAVRFDMDNWLLTPNTTRDAVVYSEAALGVVGEGLRDFLTLYRPEGRGGLDLQTHGRIGEGAGAWSGTVRCDDISVRYSKFPYALDHMMGTLEMPAETEAMDVVFEQLRCRHEGVDVVIGGSAKKAEGRWGYQIHVASDNMRFDEGLRAALSERRQALWQTFSPGGTARIDYRFGREPGGERQELLIAELDGATATYAHFPYPLENLRGTVRIESDCITLKDVASHYDGDDRVITLNGQVEGIASESPRFNMTIDANDVPIDATLRAALPERQRQFYEHFDMDAITDARIRVFPNEVSRRPLEYIAEVRISDASMVYHEFPLPLTDVDVDARLTAETITLDHMTARCKGGRVEVSGDIWPVSDRMTTAGFCLLVKAEGLQLEEELLLGLPEEVREAAAELRPEGPINLTATLNINSPSELCEPFHIAIECLGNSFHPVELPYAVEGVTGRIEITPQDLRLAGFHLPNLALTAGVEKILPADAQKLYAAIGPAGAVDVDIERARFFKDVSGQSQVDFAGDVKLKGCAFGDIGRVTGLEGVLRIDALYAPEAGLLRGDAGLNAECMTIKGRRFSDVHADIHYDPAGRRFVSRDFESSFYGGTVLGDVEIVQRGSGLRYDVSAVFDGVNIGGLVAANRSGDVLLTSDSHGRASGSFGLRGTFGRVSSNLGRLRVGIRDMKLAPRSLLGKVLDAMQLNKPSDYTFSDMSVDAFVEGGRLVFQEVVMSGTSNVLLGKGQVDLEHNEVNLEFKSYGTTVDSNPSFLETLARGLGAAVVRVEVSGTLDEPRVVTKPLPVLSEPLELLGPGRAKR